MIPNEIPDYEILHDSPEDGPPVYCDYWPWGVGVARCQFWGNDEKAIDEELKRKDAARASLGGFGFRA